MKMILKLLMFSMVMMVIQKTMYAQETTAVPFLLIAPDSRAGSMGESGAGLADNSAAIFWNPAGIAFTKSNEVSITHSKWLPQFNLDIFYDYLTYMQYMPDINGSITASITFMNYGQFAYTTDSPTPLSTFNAFDGAATVGYATRLSDDWGLGVNFRIIYSHLASQGAGIEQGKGISTSVSFDVGGMWRPAKLILPVINTDIGGNLSIGLDLSNLGPKMYYIDRAQADPIPTNFRLGFAYQVFHDDYNSLVYTIDFNKLLVAEKMNPVDSSTTSDEFYKAIFTSWTNQSLSKEFTTIQTSMGVEYWYGTPGDFLFAIRAGFFYEDPNQGNRKFITFGAGIRYDIYGFDFSYISTSVFPGGDTSPLANTLRFTLSVGWGNSATTYRGIPRGV